MTPVKNSDFNNISAELKSKLKNLAPGESVTFELLQAEKDHLTGRPLYGGARTIPGRDRIRDGETVVEIGVVDKTTATLDGVKVRCKKKVFTGGGENGTVPARFTLNGDNVDDNEWYKFFQLCNFNASNPNAAPSVPKLIKEIDFAAEAKQRGKYRKALTEAMTSVESMENETILMMAASMNYDITKPVSVLREDLGSFAQANPQAFLDKRDDKRTQIMAEMKIAEQNGFLAYDMAKHSLKDKNGVLLVTLDRIEGQNWMETFADGVLTNKSTKDAWEPVRKRVTEFVKSQKAKSSTDDTNQK